MSITQPSRTSRHRTRPSSQSSQPSSPPVIIEGTISHVRFFNPENGYSVLSVDVEGQDDIFGIDLEPVTVVGNMPSIRQGDKYKFVCVESTHPRFGKQLLIQSHELIMPTSRQGIATYLASIAYGIGPMKAKAIVSALGEDCLEKIGADPSILSTVPGITEEQSTQIHTALTGNKVLAELSSLICRQGITPRMAQKIYDEYGADSINVVKENPYLLADDLWGVGFKKADAVAQATGIAEDSPFRIQAALLYMLKEAENDGHCYLRPRDTADMSREQRLSKTVGKGHSIVPAQVGAAAAVLIEQGRLVRDGDCIYGRELYEAECEVAGRIRALAGRTIDAAKVDGMIDSLKAKYGITYAEKQREAISMALSSPVSVVSGPPGSGKSTICKAIIEAFSLLHPYTDLHLCSPTGRAAKRLSQATSHEAKTIHRMLEYSPQEGGFTRNELNPLDGPGLLVIDEASMMDIRLARDLFRAVPDNMQVVIIGDVDQLPSVGPGSVLRDIIASGAVPTTFLDFVYRQTEGSEIALLANMIRQGMVADFKSFSREVKAIIVEAEDEIPDIVTREAMDAFHKYGSMGYMTLSPMRRGKAGVNNLNERVREAVNPAGPGLPEITIGGETYRMGDKVMITKNMRPKDVYNGDAGIVTEIKDKEGFGVRFDDCEVFFNRDDPDVENVTMAHCFTIHKAQGGESPKVIISLSRGQHILLAKNLIYTAVTRAKRELVLICQEGAFETAVKNTRVVERFSRLAERLRGE